jgi:hypothetical protein
MDNSLSEQPVETSHLVPNPRRGILEQISALIVTPPELRMCVNVGCRYCNFKPDPVCAFQSGWEDFAIQYRYVVWRYVVLLMDSLVETCKHCFVAWLKVFHRRMGRLSDCRSLR